MKQPKGMHPPARPSTPYTCTKKLAIWMCILRPVVIVPFDLHGVLYWKCTSCTLEAKGSIRIYNLLDL